MSASSGKESGKSPMFAPVRHDPVYRKLHEILDLARQKNVPTEITEALTDVIALAERRELYMDKHCSPESDTLREIRIATDNTDWGKLHEDGLIDDHKSARMMTGKLEGEFLKHLVSMQQAKRVLDIGMFTGYSALAMAEALPADGVVVTCDVEQYLGELNRKKFDESPHGKKIDIRIGAALQTLMSLADEGQKYDVVFIDADKDNYCNYYNATMDQGLLAHNGTILFDNAFRMGRAYTNEGEPADTLNRLVEKDPRVRRVLLPVRDGVLMVRRTEDVVITS